MKEEQKRKILEKIYNEIEEYSELNDYNLKSIAGYTSGILDTIFHFTNFNDYNELFDNIQEHVRNKYDVYV